MRGVDGTGLRVAIRPRLADAFLVLALGALIFVGGPATLRGRGLSDSVEVRTPEGSVILSLLEDGEHRVEGALGPARLIVVAGRARLVNVPCPLKICEGMGPIDRAGQTILCVPSSIVVKVAGREAVDAVSR